MDFADPPHVAALRDELRAWLRDNLPPEWSADGARDPALAAEVAAGWRDRLRAGRWLGATWPVEYGGRNLDLLEVAAMNEEFARAGAPEGDDDLGEVLVGPTLLVWGTDDQKARYLPAILAGEATWCQGFSEPDAGSDLASLRTRAVRDGDGWSITGQKVWTSHAHASQHMILLARTDPGASKHAGITYFLLDMDQPGVRVRPLIRIDGSPEFSEVFFDDARCADADVLGPVNEGWRVANTTLQHERGASAASDYWRFLHEWQHACRIAADHGRLHEPVVRDLLAKAYTTVQVMRCNGSRLLTKAARDDHGDEANALAMITKLHWTEYHQAFTTAMVDMPGLEGLLLTGEGATTHPGGVGRGVGSERYPVSRVQADFFFARAETIWGGTSQIQRNLIAERVLGLPREPKP